MRTALHEAAAKGDTQATRAYLAANPQWAEERDSNGETPLLVAARGRHEATAVELARAADVRAHTDDGWTALHAAASSGQLELGKLLIDRGADVNAEWQYAGKPLQSAARAGQVAMAELLIANGADINAIGGENSLGPLHEANDSLMVDLLVRAGADVNRANHFGLRPLHAAARHANLDAARRLLELNADAHARTEWGGTALHGLRDEQLDVLDLLLRHGADPNAADQHGGTPLFTATGEKVIARLIDAGATYDFFSAVRFGKAALVRAALARDPSLVTRKWQDWAGGPVLLAAREGHAQVVEALLDAGGDVHDTASFGDVTALSVAADQGHVDVVRLLLNRGASTAAPRYTPLGNAARAGHAEIVRLLLQAGAEVNTRAWNDGITPLHLAAGSGSHECVTLLFARGADVHAQKNGYTPLHSANTPGIAAALLDAGADLEARTDWGGTPLHCAVDSRSPIDVARRLISRGANVNTRDRNGWTPLYRAVREGRTDIADLLLEAGADLHTVTGSGSTLIHAAVESHGAEQKFAVIHWALDRGLDVNARDRAGRTPLDLARTILWPDIASFLRQAGAN